MKRRVKQRIKYIQKGLPLYQPFKIMLEKRGVDSATAGQTSWLFVSLLIGVICGLIFSIVYLIVNVKSSSFRYYDDFIIAKTIFYGMIFHFFIVMFRLKYLLINVLFIMILYVGYITIDITDISLLVCIGLSLFIIYMLIPVYSWRIKSIDGILYALYAFIAWIIVNC